MASLANQTISSSYDGLIKTATDNAVGVSGVQLLEDGSGNSLALSVGRANNGVTITGNLAVDTNTLYVDAANNWVGIGKTSRLDTQTKFQISSGDSGVTSFSSFGDDVIIEHSTNVGLTFATPNDGFASILFADPEVSGAGSILYDHSGDNLRISTNNAEAMRIDSSGNVGIGTSSPSELLEVSSATGSTSVNPSVIRISTTTSAGTWTNDAAWGAMQFYSADVSDGGAKVHGQISANVFGTTGGVSDLVFSTAAPSTGTLTERMRLAFGDRMILSGGVLFNGDTAAANALDDYEEGTFTPEFRDEAGALTVTYDVQSGTYTKIGNVVTFTISLGTDSVTIPTPSSQLRVNLPFTVRSGHSQGFSLGYNYNFATALEPYPTGISGSDRLIFYSVNSVNASPASSLNTGTNSNRLIITGTYLT